MGSTNHNKSVFVVEDDIELSTVIDRVIRSIDSKIALDWSTTAEEAIQTIHTAHKNGVQRPYDLIIADIFLDGSKNGLDLWKACKRDYPSIPVVLTSATELNKILSGHDLPETPIYLQKPFNINECKKLFKKLLN